MDIKKEFKEFLEKIKMYEPFETEVRTQRNLSFDGLFLSGWINKKFPGTFVQDSFHWHLSITQKKKDAYDIWNSVHWRWKEHINNIVAEDKAEFHKRSW